MAKILKTKSTYYICLIIKLDHFRSVVVAIRVWLDSYPDDFRDPPLHTTLQRLILFAQQHFPGSELHLKAKHKFQRLVNETVTGMGMIDTKWLIFMQLVLWFNFICSADGCKLYPYDDRICFSKSEPHAVSYGLSSIPPELFAEQLTRIDVVSTRYWRNVSLINDRSPTD